VGGGIYVGVNEVRSSWLGVWEESEGGNYGGRRLCGNTYCGVGAFCGDGAFLQGLGAVFLEGGYARVYPKMCGKCLFEGVCSTQFLCGSIRAGGGLRRGAFALGAYPK